MRGCAISVVLVLAATVFIAKPVTATTTDTNGTEVFGTCGPLWSMLAGDRPDYEDVAATNGSDIGVSPDAEAVQATCQQNAVRRTWIGVVLAVAVLVIFLRRRRVATPDKRTPGS